MPCFLPLPQTLRKVVKMKLDRDKRAGFFSQLEKGLEDGMESARHRSQTHSVRSGRSGRSGAGASKSIKGLDDDIKRELADIMGSDGEVRTVHNLSTLFFSPFFSVSSVLLYSMPKLGVPVKWLELMQPHVIRSKPVFEIDEIDRLKPFFEIDRLGGGGGGGRGPGGRVGRGTAPRR